MHTNFYIYIMASQKNGTLYIGVTNDLKRRVEEHKLDIVKGFTKKYQVHMLVYFEVFGRIEDAIKREKQLKIWKRDWKLKLIEENNCNWKDLYNKLFK
ncbi:MAG: GIY-YIG nuclease family protein [Patescibacteria group bacterium]